MSHEPAIYTQDLAKSYGRIQALSGLSMTVPQGEVFGFLGPNGAGKTTAVKLLLGLTPPSSGEGWVLGVAIGDAKARKKVGYLPELFRYQDWMTAREVLAFHLALARIERSSWPKEMDRALETVGLKDRGDVLVKTFSKGMTQRLGLGVALVGDPELVFLDEPTSALDPVGCHDVRRIIRGLKDRGTTVFLNSHLLTEVELVSDRVAMVDKGRVIASGNLKELLSGRIVRLKVTGLSHEDEESLSGFGPVQKEADGLSVRGLAEDAVPDLVEAIVRLGGRVYAVESPKETLESRFLDWLGGP